MVPEERDRSRLLPRLILVGFGLRALLAMTTLGTQDIGTWLWFAEAVSEGGLEQTYLDERAFNHPPLMGLLAVLALRVSSVVGVPFSIVFKMPSLVAEGVTAYLLHRIWSERGGRDAGLLAAAAYALALGPIVISGYHGNTDAIYFCLALAAAYLMESKRSPFWAGLAMAGALNVKLIPIVVVLPLWSRCLSLRGAGRYALGGILGATPFVWALASFGAEARVAFLERLLLYRSNIEYWGVELFVRWGEILLDPVAPVVAGWMRTGGDAYLSYGGEIVMAATALLAGRQLVVSRRNGRTALDAYELTFLGFAIFLLFGPGFGVQYVGCVVAPLMAVAVRRGFVVASITGVFITAVYVYFVVDWSPVRSVHTDMPPGFTPLALLAWGSVLWAAWISFRPLRPNRGG